MSEKFKDVAAQAFAFLERDGFQLSDGGAGRLRYESAVSAIEVTWDSRSGELEAFVGLGPSARMPHDLYSLTDVRGMVGAQEQELKFPVQVSDEMQLQPFVDQLARSIQIHARAALDGDRMFFRRLETYRSSMAEALAREKRLRKLRSEAEAAWQKKDFQKVVDLYESEQSYLTESEKLRLNYAKSQQLS